MMDDAFISVRYIGEQVEADFNKPPAHIKSPPCPDRFTWNERTYEVTENLKQWTDYSRKGRFKNNMQPHNKRKAIRRGSWGVGRFYYRVLTRNDHYFELYYDRRPMDVDDRYGRWILYRELMPAPEIGE